MEDSLIPTVTSFCNTNGIVDSGTCQEIYNAIVERKVDMFQRDQEHLHRARIYERWRGEGNGEFMDIF